LGAVRGLDCRLIGHSAQLRRLDLASVQVRNPRALASLTALRELWVCSCRGVNDVEFARGMVALKRLRLEWTAVADLSPLGGLASLETVVADVSRVQRLPDGPMPALRTLSLLSSEVSPDAVAAFTKAHPACEVRYQWQDTLERRLRGAVRLRVADWEPGGRGPLDTETLFEVKDAKAVQQLIAKIRVVELPGVGTCGCTGGPILEFYGRDKNAPFPIVRLTLHHGVRLRRTSGWPGDAPLTKESAEFLCGWLAKHGVTEPKAERERELRRSDPERPRRD
jgi:hypothetical protein